mmetsp:Transcript_25745/g.22844  ORF Transcript_25745/g.22844 Transcript_25745/m.22844 type:complete len:95 (+) Transcript_25745:229-513(+)
MGLMIAFSVWELLFMMFGITIHFALQNLFQIVLHITAVLYLVWSIFATWTLDYYWTITLVLGLIPWLVDISLFWWAIFRFRPRGTKKMKIISQR